MQDGPAPNFYGCVGLMSVNREILAGCSCKGKIDLLKVVSKDLKNLGFMRAGRSCKEI